ncbi:MAG: hypothetical protein L6V93_17480 [Clostridiales bacterium]|nr:MAG: hypothetical protein L6V93_17480 [Clostridiales bacterium]
MLKNGKSSFTAEDKGKIEINGTTIKNAKSKAYGNLDLESAFLHSSNVYFCACRHRNGRKRTAPNVRKLYDEQRFQYQRFLPCAVGFSPTKSSMTTRSRLRQSGRIKCSSRRCT